MDYKVLYRKYRPDDFNNVCGQDYSIKILKNSILKNKISHAYLFTGPRGTGKTSTAKIFAKAINCLDPIDGNPCGKCDSCLNISENPDIIEIDAASNNGVDEIREIINNVKIAPSFSKYKVYIIDEVHMLTTSAFNALLLTLEEPPGHVVFILATTDVQEVPITILSRCQRFDFKPIDNEVIYNRLKNVCELENISITDDALHEIAYVSNGGLRDALSILDQLSGNSESITIEDVYHNFGVVSNIKIKNLIDSFIDNDISSVSNIIAEFKSNGVNYSIIIEKIIDSLKKLAIEVKIGNNIDISFNKVYDLIIDLNNCLNNVNININPYVLIELTILKYVDTNQNIDLGNKKYISREIKNDENWEINDEKAEKNEVFVENNEIVTDTVKLDDMNKEIDIDKKIEKKSVISSPKVNISDELKKIRVNNAFVNANKEFKNNLINSFDSFKDYLESDYKSLFSILVDSNVVLASDKYAVISVSSQSTCNMINNKISEIEDKFKSTCNLDYKFICLSDSEWKEETNLFIKNKNNGIIYEYMEEPSTSIENIENDDLGEIASNLFGDDVIEYE